MGETGASSSSMGRCSGCWVRDWWSYDRRRQTDRKTGLRVYRITVLDLENRRRKMGIRRRRKKGTREEGSKQEAAEKKKHTARREQALTSRGIGALVEREIGTDFVVSRFQGSSSVFLKDSVPSSSSSSSASASSSSLVSLAHLLLFFFFFMLLEEAGMCAAQAPCWISFSSSSCPKAQRNL
ncbi:unnamed protein product [Sphagnum tenellum]